MTAPLAWIPTNLTEARWTVETATAVCSVEIVDDGTWFGQAISKDGEVVLAFAAGEDRERVMRTIESEVMA